MSETIAIFGAGEQGRVVASYHHNAGDKVICFIDNAKEKQGSTVLGVPVISMSEFRLREDNCVVEITGDPRLHASMISQLIENGIQNYRVFDKRNILEKERIISFSYPTENEDIILYHVLRKQKNVFWVDVGCNDPDIGNVTRLFYNMGYRGINIDMEPHLIELTEHERPRDINICAGMGSEKGEKEYYSQGDFNGLSTFVAQNVLDHRYQKKTAHLTTLVDICEKYVGDQEISFLKIDVEGFEKEVLLGADFKRFRPLILIIEATMPGTDIANYLEWEEIVLKNGYHHAYSHGVNRYYVADEHKELDKEFLPWNLLSASYCILQAQLVYYS